MDDRYSPHISRQVWMAGPQTQVQAQRQATEIHSPQNTRDSVKTGYKAGRTLGPRRETPERAVCTESRQGGSKLRWYQRWLLAYKGWLPGPLQARWQHTSLGSKGPPGFSINKTSLCFKNLKCVSDPCNQTDLDCHCDN